MADNLIFSPENFSAGDWFEDENFFAWDQTVTAPDGNTTGTRLSERTANSDHRIRWRGRGSLYQTYGYFSCFLKAGSRDWAYLMHDLNGSETWFNLSTGQVGSGVSGGSMVAYTNGWWRCFIAVKLTLTTTSSWRIGAAAADNTRSYSGVIFNYPIYVWGAQITVGGLYDEHQTYVSPTSGWSSATGYPSYKAGLELLHRGAKRCL